MRVYIRSTRWGTEYVCEDCGSVLKAESPHVIIHDRFERSVIFERLTNKLIDCKWAGMAFEEPSFQLQRMH